MRHTCLDNLRISHQHLPVHRHVGGIGQITEEVKAIKSGRADCQLHPNKQGLQQQDIVATNTQLGM